VVVNPFLVFDRYLNKGKEGGGIGVLGDEDFAGWCVLNSTERPAEKQQHGFQGTLHTRNNAAYGVRLFLNICASYLKAKNQNEGEGRQQNKFHYEEPFGAFTEVLGTQEFPRFDYDCPAILQQDTGYDCGLAVVANSMAFVKHSKKLQFKKANMKRQKSNEVRFLLDENTYSLKKFWDRLMKDASNTRHDKFSSSNKLFPLMQEEYIEIVDEITGESALENQFYDDVRRVIEQTKAPAAARKPDMTIRDSDSEHESLTLPDGDNDEIAESLVGTACVVPGPSLLHHCV
jgi:hypothetical protein